MLNDELQAPTVACWHSSFIIHHSSFSFPPCLFAQDEVIRLPAVVPEEPGPPGQLVRIPIRRRRFCSRRATATWPRPRRSRPSRGFRRACGTDFSKKLLFDATWLAPGGTNGMGDEQSAIAGHLRAALSDDQLAAGDYARALRSISCRGRKYADLPPRLYQSYVDFRWLSQVTPTLGLDLAITPGVFSDFDQESGKAFRLQGHGAAAWTWNETTKLVAGAAYLDRPDVEVIPIGGVVWTPTTM